MSLISTDWELPENTQQVNINEHYHGYGQQHVWEIVKRTKE